jgi:hypothetical protein
MLQQRISRRQRSGTGTPETGRAGNGAGDARISAGAIVRLEMGCRAPAGGSPLGGHPDVG